MSEINKDDEYYSLACILSDHLHYELQLLGAKTKLMPPVKEVSVESTSYQTVNKTKIYVYSQIDQDFYSRLVTPGQGFILASMIIGGVHFLVDAIEVSKEKDPRSVKARELLLDLHKVESVLTERAIYLVTTYETYIGQA